VKDVDLGKLQVNRGTTFSLQAHVKRRLRWWHVAIAAGVVLTVAGFAFLRAPLVQTTAVVTAFPSQQYVVQNGGGVQGHGPAGVAGRVRGQRGD